jgi:hypothetical protein
MDPLENSLRDLLEIRKGGAPVKETSYHPPLANLLNAAGPAARPWGHRVRGHQG